MKRYLLLGCAILVSFDLFSQRNEPTVNVDSVYVAARVKFNEEAFTFSLTDTISGNKDQLFIQSLSWLAKKFSGMHDAVQVYDKEYGRIIGKQVVEIPNVRPGILSECPFNNLRFVITIDVKDNKYKIVLSNFMQENSQCEVGVTDLAGGSLSQKVPNWGPDMQKRWNKSKALAQEEAHTILRSYIREMRKKRDFQDF
jgi:hypothetical protein